MKIFNSMTGKKRELNPLIPGQFNIYACGPTVYNYFHIGNARPFIVFDTLRRYLEYRGYKVNFVQNFTDVDDKMIRVAAEEGITVRNSGTAISGNILRMRKRLISARHRTSQGDGAHRRHHCAGEKAGRYGACLRAPRRRVFRYAELPGYGRLSGQDLSELEMGARIDINEEKKNPMDFAPLESEKEGRSLGRARGGRPPGMAHRMLGNEHEISRRYARYSRRRAGLEIPAP